MVVRAQDMADLHSSPGPGGLISCSLSLIHLSDGYTYSIANFE